MERLDERPGCAVVAVVLQTLEAGASLLIEDYDFAIERSLVLQLLQGSGDRPIALGEGLSIARVQSHFAKPWRLYFAQ